MRYKSSNLLSKSADPGPFHPVCKLAPGLGAFPSLYTQGEQASVRSSARLQADLTAPFPLHMTAKVQTSAKEAVAKAKEEAHQLAEKLAHSKEVQRLKRRTAELADWAAPHKGWEDDKKQADESKRTDPVDVKRTDPVDVKLYRKFERDGSRPAGRLWHEVAGLLLVCSLVILPAALLRTIGWNALMQSVATLEAGGFANASSALKQGAAAKYATVKADSVNATSLAAQGAVCANLATSVARRACWMDAYLDTGHAVRAVDS